MNNQEIAQLLKAVAAAYEIKDEKKYRFQIIAYQEAANSLENANREAEELWREKKLNSLSGIGQKISKYLNELFLTGQVKHFQKLLRQIYPAVFIFMEIPGIGAKKAFKLSRALGIQKEKNALNKLKNACLKNKISKIEGFGLKSEKLVLESIAEYERRGNRLLLFQASEVAQKIIDYLLSSPQVEEAFPLGSLRRQCATIGDLDIAVATSRPSLAITHFLKYPNIKKIISQGAAKVSVLLKNNQQVDLRFQKKSSFGSLLQYFTGSKTHNIHLRAIALKRHLSLSEYGIKKSGRTIKFSSEENLYRYLKMDCPPPELREDKGEIEAGLSHQLPQLVKESDIKGDLHLHTDFNTETNHDLGASSIAKIFQKASELGYEFLGFSDHTPSVSNHSEEQIITLIKKRNETIEQFIKSIKNTHEKRREKIMIFKGMEVDILTDGRLSLPDKALGLLDYALVSIHSGMHQPKEKMTQRVLSALNHPKVKILAHPTGRRLNFREGFKLDWDKIFACCQRNHQWLEINACPDRLDLPEHLVFEAIKSGIKLVINTDSHEACNLRFMRFGVSVARRGWAEKKDIINTLPVSQFQDIIKSI